MLRGFVRLLKSAGTAHNPQFQAFVTPAGPGLEHPSAIVVDLLG
jgi:hypothetical protein